MNDKWEFYKDVGGKWRWRRTAPNGNIIGASTEGYSNKIDCEGNARRNGWDDGVEVGKIENAIEMIETNGEAMDVKSKAYDLLMTHGFTLSNEFANRFEAERLLTEKHNAQRHRQMKSILMIIVGILFGIIAILLLTLFKEPAPINLAQQPAPDVKVMMVVLDPKVDEKVVVFGDTYFGFDKSTLSEEAKSELNKDVLSLKENPNINVRMAGYTSAQGTEERNQELSEERANAVRDYLIKQGIAPERITVIGYGRTKPAVYEVTPSDNNSKEARENMRVLFEVVVK